MQLVAVKNSAAEAAMDWITQHMDDPGWFEFFSRPQCCGLEKCFTLSLTGVNDPIPVAAAAANEPNVDPNMLEMLASMVSVVWLSAPRVTSE